MTTNKVGRPRKYKPQVPTISKEEEMLFNMAFNLAKKEGCSFEKAFASIIKTQEGKILYEEIKE